MAYIPKEHKKYGLLPKSDGKWEVFSYSSELLNEITIKNKCKLSYPYQPDSYESYYAEIDNIMKKYPKIKELLMEYKNDYNCQ